MSAKHLTSFKVENFKRFDSLEVKDIGQFNLIVGDNNVGKTSLLEALLFDDENYATFLSNIAFALFVKGILQTNVANYEFLDFYLKQKADGIKYQYQYNNENEEALTISRKLFGEIEDVALKKLSRFFVLQPNMPESMVNFAIEFDTENNKEYEFSSNVPLNFQSNKAPYISSNVVNDKNIAFFFSQLSINSQKLESLKNELSYFIPKLISIETNNALIPQQVVIAIREHEKDLIPISQYGDGTIKLLRYLLELEFCESKRLMIDEIDAGIHYSRMKEFLKKILQSAKNKNVQIFATTHSKECMKYYAEALQELNMQDSGRIIRIADTKSGTKAYTMRFDEFDNALFADNEIR